MLRLCYDRIPRPIRPSWRVWKEMSRAFGDPRRASLALIAQATADLQEQLKKKMKDQ